MSASSVYVYEPFVAELYDSNPVCRGRSDVQFFVEAAREAHGTILELGCGTGRILLPIAAAGHRIVGLDLSPAMLARCREKLAQHPREVRERVRLVQANMADFELGESFRLAIIPFRPFQHLLTVEDQLACLRRANRHLPAGGRLILDFFHTDPRRIFDPAFLKESSGHPEVELPDGRRLKLSDRTVAFHRAAQCNEVELIYTVSHPDGRSERFVQAFSVRYFFRYEVAHLLARCGFRVAAFYGNYDRSAFADDSPEMIFVAEKVKGPAAD